MEHNNSKISQLVKENIKFLKTLAYTNSERKKKKLLKKATREQLLSIAEICINIVKSRFNLTTRQKKRLIPHADFVRKLSRARSERGARKILIQKGSGVGSLFAALLTPIIIEAGRYLLGEI